MNDTLTQEVIGATYRVQNTLGFGFLESVYEKAMAIELPGLKQKFQLRHPIQVFYEDQQVGDC